MKRLRRSDSSMMVASRSALASSSSDFARSRSAPAAPSTAASGVLRSCEIDVSSAERRRSVSATRRTRSMSSTRCTRSIASAPWSLSASSSRRCSARTSGPAASLEMPRMPTAPRPVRIGRNSHLAPGSASESAPGGPVLLPGPLGRGQIALLEPVLRRIARLDRDRRLLGKQQHHAHLQHGRDLVRGRPQHVVERAGAGELAAERIERLDRAHALVRRHRLHAAARRQVGDDEAQRGEQRERRDVGGIGDRERVERRQEEEVVGERCRGAGRPATATARSAQQCRRSPSGR